MSGRDPDDPPGRDPEGPPGRGPPDEGGGPGGRGPPDDKPGRGPPDIASVKSAKKSVENMFFRKKNVHAVSVGLKYVDGRRTDETSIVVHVTEKIPEDELEEDDRIPRRVKIAGKGDVKTDVKQSPIPEPESTEVAMPARWGPHRPVFGGIRLSLQGRSTYVSLGCAVETSSGDLRLLTNRHIVGGDVENPPTGGEVITQPAVDEEVVGQLEEWSDWTVDGTNTSDSALISLDAGIEAANHVMSIGPVGPSTQASLGDVGVNSGARTHGVASTVDELDYTGYISFEPTITFTGLIAFRPHNTDGGDSGSIWGVYDDSTNQVHPVGLNFAGGGASNASLAIPWSAVEDEHGTLSAPSTGLVSDVSPRNTVNKTEVLPYELETGSRAVLKCLAARYGDPASPTEEPIELYDGPIVDGSPSGTLIGEKRLETEWGEVAEIEFRGLIEKLGVGSHTVTLSTNRPGPREYNITITQPTEHRFYGTVTDTRGNRIADASVNTYRR